jgi:ArsR family transcriptional regulator, arsenate/arsenite/antimonite-responsive transcriptional repressor
MQIREALAALSALTQETCLASYRLLVEAGPEGLAARHIAASFDTRKEEQLDGS